MSSNPDVTELEKLSERSITKMSNADSLTHIGKLIDKSDEMSFERGSKRAIFLLEQLSERDLTDADQALIEYFKANAWATRARISSGRNDSKSLVWILALCLFTASMIGISDATSIK